MRKLLVFASLLAACNSAPSREDRAKELYARIAYLRAGYDTAYADYNSVALDAIYRELKRHADREQDLFLEDLNTAENGRKRLAAFALAFAEGSQRAQQGLLAALGNDKQDRMVLETCLIALGMLRMPDTPLTAFTARFTHAVWSVRQAALYGFRFQLEKVLEVRGTKLDDATFQAVVARLSDLQMDVRNEAVITLRQVRSRSIVAPLVLHSLKDGHPLVRQNAAITLGSLGPDGEEAVSFLIDVLRDPDTKVVEAAWTALQQITGREFDRTYAWWRDWYEDEEKRVEYVCPEHPGVSENSPGVCPKCSNPLRRQLRPEDYRCPVHPDVRLGRAGRCTVCKKSLEARRPDYACPDHPLQRFANSRPCPTCQKRTMPVREVFVCPEHLDVEAPFPGRCSRCERDLIRKVEYLCSVHPDVQGKRLDLCRKCNRALVVWIPDYVCRDHANTRSDRPGKCPICQKERLPVVEKWTCTSHPDVEAPRSGKCSQCEADLVPKK